MRFQGVHVGLACKPSLGYIDTIIYMLFNHFSMKLMANSFTHRYLLCMGLSVEHSVHHVDT